ncbi:SURF1 family protein [Tessaracoccus rhinocerotis]|uniref:SURF1-like protein n=2 Tax=Tessaracoccus rhinocerotis TaxID=1689449 RepID=A0A553K2K2_9ACTN|nr:SURF1 family protein [Tessaracoccus rhinocerotis]
MKKMILRWVALAVFLSLVAFACVKLGEWQLDRLEQRREGNSAVVANEGLAPVPYREVMGSPIADDEQWQRVELTGSYTGEQYQVRYRNYDDSAGIEVAAVFETLEGDSVLVDRGFIARQAGQPDTEVLPEPPTGEVAVMGYVHRDEQGDETAVVPHDFKVRLINSEAIGASLGRVLLPGYVILATSDPANGEALVPMEPPTLDEGNHFSYALQWFAFGGIALIGIGVLIRADLQDRKKARQRAEKRARLAEARARRTEREAEEVTSAAD